MSVDFPAPEGPSNTAVLRVLDVARQRVHAEARHGAGDEHVASDRHTLDRSEGGIGRGGCISLGQHDRRYGPRVPDQRELTLDATEIGVRVDGVDKEDRVDVRGEDLDAPRARLGHLW